VPLLSMSALAGERREGRLALLLGMGLTPTRIVLGKYCAVLAWLLGWLLLTLAMPLALAHATSIDWGKLAAAALGVALLLAALAALGLACSAFASHPALAAAAALVITLGLWAVNLGAQMAGVDDGALNWLAMSSHLQPMLRGLVASPDVAWFVLLGAVCLALAIRRVAAERERD
jgi:ABC-2 type transport system permease protein